VKTEAIPDASSADRVVAIIIVISFRSIKSIVKNEWREVQFHLPPPRIASTPGARAVLLVFLDFVAEEVPCNCSSDGAQEAMALLVP